MKQRNFVKKHMDTFNRATIQVDRKKQQKRGAQKHKVDYRTGKDSRYTFFAL